MNTDLQIKIGETLLARGALNWDTFMGSVLEKQSRAISVAVKARGVPNDGTGADTALASLFTDLLNQPGRDFKLIFESGTYSLGDTVIPSNVIGIEPEHEHGAVLLRSAATPTVWLAPRASNFVAKGMVFDANKELVPVPNTSMDGYVALLLQKPTSLSGGGTSLAGGIPLSAAATAGATSISVTRSYSGPAAAASTAPIVPGDVLNICGGGVFERVRVHRSYVPGGLSIPLEGQLVNGYATSANVTHCQTNCLVEGNIFRGSGCQGALMYCCSIVNNQFTNQIDLSAGTFDRGSYGVLWHGNEIETYSYWAINLDDFTLNDDVYPPNDMCVIAHNRMRFLRGGPDVGTGPGAGNLDLVAITGARRTLVQGNTLDIRGATAPSGPRAVRINPNGQHTRVIGNTMLGDGAAFSVGVKVVTIGATDPDAEPEIVGNHIERFNDGVELGQSLKAIVMGNKFRDITRYAIGQTYGRSDAAVARHVIDGNDIGGTGIYGIYLDSGGTYPVGSGYIGSNLVRAGITTAAVLAPNASRPPTGLPEMNLWKAPTLVNSWVNEGVSYRNAGYRLTDAGELELLGAIKGGASGTVAFTLPAGYRPPTVISRITACSGGVAHITIDTAGAATVTQISGAVTTWTELDGLTFAIT